MESDGILLPADIYIKYLTVISDIKFTPREIDIIACVLHGKNTKGIANFLSNERKPIGEKSVETHLLNIRRKIGGNARESIINFIEKSNKYQIVRNYYSSLLIEKEFKKALEEVLLLIKPYVQSFIIISSQQDTEISLIKRLQEHLEFLVDNVSIETRDNFALNSLLMSFNQEGQHTIYVVPKEKQEALEKSIEAGKVIENSSAIENSSNSSTSVIFLLQGTITATDNNITSDLPKFEYINLAWQANYYFLFFEILRKFLPKLNFNKIEMRFRERYENIRNSKSTYCSLDHQVLPKQQKDIKIHLSLFFRKNPYLYTFLTIFIICCSFSSFYGGKIWKEQDSIPNPIQKNVTEILPKIFNDLSVRNLTNEEADKNHNTIKQFDQAIEQITSGQIYSYFNASALQSNELVNCLYNLNAISSYFLFKEHDAEKAEKILKFAKSLAESYLKNRSKLRIDFDNLTVAEIYTELSIIKDLPEMYTITIYFLGRSLIYQKNIGLAKKYFEISKYLGEKLALFEGVLSVINGLAIIKGDQAKLNIQNKAYEQAKNRLNECINIYKKIKKDNKEYTINYRPNNQEQKIIIPEKDIYNILDCSKRIVKLYMELITIADSKNEKNKYLEIITDQYIGNKSSLGILEILTDSNSKLARIAADSYNTLGDFLLTLNHENINFRQLKDSLIQKIELTDGDDLEVIYQVFDLAKSLSRSTEFSKADAYSGLARVCERMANRDNIAIEEKNRLLIKASNFRQEQNLINKELKRTLIN